MRNTILATLLATASLFAVSGAAHACPHGYKRVVIQGNSVCRIDISTPNKLKAPGHGGGERAIQGPRRISR